MVATSSLWSSSRKPVKRPSLKLILSSRKKSSNSVFSNSCRRKPRLDNQPADWSYQVEIWQFLSDGQNTSASRNRGKKKWKLADTITPLRLGKPLPLIPFIFHGPRHSLPDVDKIPLADIIAVNLDHYRLNADYKHGMHFTALPTAWVSGFDKNFHPSHR